MRPKNYPSNPQQPVAWGDPPTARYLDKAYAITYIRLMRTLSSSALRANLSAEMDKVNDDHEPVIVTRAKGKPW